MLSLNTEPKESTLSKQLKRRGCTRKALLQSEQASFRRFEAKYRNACRQGGVQHTLYLPHPDKPGKKKMAYLVLFIEDLRNTRRDNARLLTLRDPASGERWQESSETAVAENQEKTGLNFVELAYEEYQQQQRKEQSIQLESELEQMEVKE